jgi:hypothetical protein
MTNRLRRPTADLLDVPVQPGKSKNHSTPSGGRTPNESVLHVSEIHARSLAQINLNGSDLGDNFKMPNNANKNSSNNNLSGSSASSLLLQDYSRNRKTMTLNYEMNEEKLKLKEQMLKHLQSIDLSKYSFPNENKPKTDYTYASTYTDYLKEPKSILDENQVEMPNLCRRSRKSPNTSLNSGSSSGHLGADTMNASVLERFVESASKTRDELVARVNVLEYFKTFSKKEETTTTTTNTITNTQTQISQPFTVAPSITTNKPVLRKEKKLVRNLVDDLEEETTTGQSNLQQGNIFSQKDSIPSNKSSFSSAASSSSSKTSTGFFTIRNLFGLDRKTPSASQESIQVNTATNSVATTSYLNSFNTQNNQHKSMTNASTMTVNGDESLLVGNVILTRNKKSRSGGSCLLCFPCLFFLFLLPLMLYGLNKYNSNYNNSFFENLNENHLKERFYLDKNMIRSLDENLHYIRKNLDGFYFETVPAQFWHVCALAKNCVNYVRENFLIKETFQKIIEYQPAHIVDQEEQKNKVAIELNDNLNSLKEKLLAEILANVNNKESNVELIKKELDQKFNYTFTLMSNRLSDQLMEIEMSKTSHEREIKQMKSVLSEIESKYGFILKQLEEQQHQIVEQQKQHEFDLNKQQQSTVVHTQSPPANNYEYISFEKIEEFINKSFYLYNADKTGMTDFASELVGGSILFTRCTEAYDGNTRWLSFFDIPITRIHVSPRVVIQVRIFYDLSFCC